MAMLRTKLWGVEYAWLQVGDIDVFVGDGEEAAIMQQIYAIEMGWCGECIYQKKNSKNITI